MKKHLKTILIALVVVVLLVGGYLLWSLFLNDSEIGELPAPEFPEVFPEAPEREAVETTIPKGEIRATHGEGGNGSEPRVLISKVSDDGIVVFHSWTNEGGGVFYITSSGFISKVNEERQDEVLLGQSISALRSAEESPSGSKLLISFGSPLGPDWAIFDPRNNNWRSLSSSLVEATWGENDNLLLAIEEGGNSRRLIQVDISNSESEQTTTLAGNFFLRDVSLSFVSPNLYLAERPTGLYEGSVWRFNTNSGNFERETEKIAGLWVERSQDNSFIFEFSSPKTLRLRGGDLPQGSFSTQVSTVPNKCNGANEAVACFVPSGPFPPTGSNIMPDSYLQKEFFTVDNLDALNRNTGEVSTILTSATSEVPAVDATNVYYHNNNLYFINRYDAGLYKLQLPEEFHPSG